MPEGTGMRPALRRESPDRHCQISMMVLLIAFGAAHAGKTPAPIEIVIGAAMLTKRPKSPPIRCHQPIKRNGRGGEIATPEQGKDRRNNQTQFHRRPLPRRSTQNKTSDVIDRTPECGAKMSLAQRINRIGREEITARAGRKQRLSSPTLRRRPSM
jgi:hypothetical protein